MRTESIRVAEFACDFTSFRTSYHLVAQLVCSPFRGCLWIIDGSVENIQSQARHQKMRFSSDMLCQCWRFFYRPSVLAIIVYVLLMRCLFVHRRYVRAPASFAIFHHAILRSDISRPFFFVSTNRTLLWSYWYPPFDSSRIVCPFFFNCVVCSLDFGPIVCCFDCGPIDCHFDFGRIVCHVEFDRIVSYFDLVVLFFVVLSALVVISFRVFSTLVFLLFFFLSCTVVLLLLYRSTSVVSSMLFTQLWS